MRHPFSLFICSITICATLPIICLAQQWPPPGADQIYSQRPDEAAEPEEVSIPNRFLTRSRGYEEALELQRQTGADIFLYISHQTPSSARGLCTWWVNRGMRAGNVQRWLRHYIKVELPLPSDAETRAIAERFNLWEGPTVAVIHPNRFSRTIRVFDRAPGGRMQLKSSEEIIQAIRDASSPQYRELDD
jgi:hypothetical protein